MRVQCSTCLELLAPGDDLTCTPCGHVFHMACVLQWFETKKNCPQCRHPARESVLRRIFLAETDGDGEEDASDLTNQLDGAKLNLRMKENERSKLATKAKELEEQGKKQRDEIKELEKAKGRMKSEYEGMRSQAKMLQGEKARCEEMGRENTHLKSRLEGYKGVEVALRGQEGALNEFLHERGAFDGRTRELGTLIVNLKQKLGDVKRERGRAEATLKELEGRRGEERERVRRLEVQVVDLQAISRNLESDLESERKEKEELRARLAAGQRSEEGEGTVSQASTQASSPQLPLMEEMEEEEWEEDGYKLPTFTRAGLVEAATPPLASSNILLTARRPLDQIQVRESAQSAYSSIWSTRFFAARLTPLPSETACRSSITDWAAGPGSSSTPARPRPPSPSPRRGKRPRAPRPR